jgi:hypothetical protein
MPEARSTKTKTLRIRSITLSSEALTATYGAVPSSDSNARRLPGDNPLYHSVCGGGWEAVGLASLTVNSAQPGVGCVVGPGKQMRCVI